MRLLAPKADKKEIGCRQMTGRGLCTLLPHQRWFRAVFVTWTPALARSRFNRQFTDRRGSQRVHVRWKAVLDIFKTHPLLPPSSIFRIESHRITCARKNKEKKEEKDRPASTKNREIWLLMITQAILACEASKHLFHS